MKLILSSENTNNIPYTFSMTNIKVYSIEEAIWHIFNYLNESLEIFENNSFSDWLRLNLNLTEEADILENITVDGNEKKLIDFLNRFSYLDEDEIKDIENRLEKFLNLGSFERQKEIGDKLYKLGKYQKAVYAYSKALKIDKSKDSIIKNNIGLCCMQCGDYENAAAFFEQAYSKDKNPIISLNLAESYIFLNLFDKAENILNKNEYRKNDFFTAICLMGNIALKKGNYKKSLDFFNLAIGINKDSSIILKMCDIFIKERRIDAAAEFLESCKVNDPKIFIRLSEIYCAKKNYFAAVMAINKGLVYFKDNAELWIMLAKCYRLNLNFSKAEAAICKAISLNGFEEEANLEFARIKKAQGKIDEYKQSLNKCLEIIKNKYLSDNEIDEK